MHIIRPSYKSSTFFNFKVCNHVIIIHQSILQTLLYTYRNSDNFDGPVNGTTNFCLAWNKLTASIWIFGVTSEIPARICFIKNEVKHASHISRKGQT